MDAVEDTEQVLAAFPLAVAADEQSHSWPAFAACVRMSWSFVGPRFWASRSCRGLVPLARGFVPRARGFVPFARFPTGGGGEDSFSFSSRSRLGIGAALPSAVPSLCHRPAAALRAALLRA